MNSTTKSQKVLVYLNRKKHLKKSAYYNDTKKLFVLVVHLIQHLIEAIYHQKTGNLLGKQQRTLVEVHWSQELNCFGGKKESKSLIVVKKANR